MPEHHLSHKLDCFYSFSGTAFEPVSCIIGFMQINHFDNVFFNFFFKHLFFYIWLSITFWKIID